VSNEANGDRGTLVWDAPLRLFHWLLAITIGVSLYTGLVGGFEEMDWHQKAGFLALGLILFRLLWGVCGPRHARFASFVGGPGRAITYARAMAAGDPPASAGHNPLAAWTICLTLLAIAVQALTGLFASDDLFVEGPLVHLVDGETSSTLTTIHHWGQWTVGGLVGLHLLAIALHRFAFGERLGAPMITGRSRTAAPEEGIERQRLPLALVLAGGVAVVVWWVVTQL
jgi:cytochrome b